MSARYSYKSAALREFILPLAPRLRDASACLVLATFAARVVQIPRPRMVRTRRISPATSVRHSATVVVLPLATGQVAASPSDHVRHETDQELAVGKSGAWFGFPRRPVVVNTGATQRGTRVTFHNLRKREEPSSGPAADRV